MENSYYSKYLKYKNKYLRLKNEKIGGTNIEPDRKDYGEVIKGIDGNFYSPIAIGDTSLKQLAGPAPIGVRPNLGNPNKSGKVVIKLCKHGTTDPKSSAIPKPDYYEYLKGVGWTYQGSEENKIKALENKFNEEGGLIAEGKATEDDLALVKDIIDQTNREGFGGEEDEEGNKATDEFNALEFCAKNRQVKDL